MSGKKASFSDEPTLLEGVIKAGSDVELYLIRLPKHVECAQLDGVKIKKFDSNCEIDELNFSMGGHILDADCLVDTSGFRAVVKGKDGADIAGPFAGCLSLRRVFKEKADTSNAPATMAYAPKTQITDLVMPRLPVGSLSTVGELRSRLGVTDGHDKTDKKKKAKKRRHEEEEEVVPVVIKAEKKQKNKAK